MYISEALLILHGSQDRLISHCTKPSNGRDKLLLPSTHETHEAGARQKVTIVVFFSFLSFFLFFRCPFTHPRASPLIKYLWLGYMGPRLLERRNSQAITGTARHDLTTTSWVTLAKEIPFSNKTNFKLVFPTSLDHTPAMQKTFCLLDLSSTVWGVQSQHEECDQFTPLFQNPATTKTCDLSSLTHLHMNFSKKNSDHILVMARSCVEQENTDHTATQSDIQWRRRTTQHLDTKAVKDN